MSGYFNTVKLAEGSGRPVDLGIKENLMAGRMISDSLNSFAENEKQEFKEAEARRLRKLQEEREKHKFDKEVNTDKALIDFQNQIASASAGGVASMEQGAQLSNEYDILLKTVGEDEAARIINDKAQKFGAQDAKRAEIDPYYRAELIKGVSLPSGNIDPKSLIDLRNSQIIRNETLGDRKEEARLTAEERAYQREMENKKFSLQQKEYNERLRERNDKRKEEELEKKSATDAINIALNTPSKDKDGLHKSTNQVGTGSYDITEVLPKENAEKLAEKYLKDEKELVGPLQERLDKLESSIITEDKLSDEAYLDKRYREESINPATQDNMFTSAFKSVYENADRVENEEKTYDEIGRLKGLLFKETDPEKREEVSNEISRLRDSLDPTKNIEKPSDGKNIEFKFDFIKRIKRENEEKIKEANSLKDKIKNQYNSINENINKDFGKEVTKEEKVTLTPDQVLKQEFDRAKGKLLELGYNEYLATKGAINAANSAAQNQKDMLNKVDSDVTKLKDSEKKKLDESKKQLEDELKAYTEIRKSVTTSRNFNGITVDGYFHKKADKAQSAIDNKISSIQKQIKDINGR